MYKLKETHNIAAVEVNFAHSKYDKVMRVHTEPAHTHTAGKENEMTGRATGFAEAPGAVPPVSAKHNRISCV